ncbi:MAG: PQQ-binding-like beta-propeller repeat protein, partial [Actinobacteria bacterium]|nr:PQQ-binding-like beta-propeller repeat protein [Actinomycetota bacterium]
LGGATGSQTGAFPSDPYGGAVAGSTKYTVIVGATAVTSYDNTTGHIRWRRPSGPVIPAWRTDGNWLYLAESSGGFADSAPVTALRRIDLSTGSQLVVRPLEGLSFAGALSAAFDGTVLFSSAARVTAYDGITGARLWSAPGAVPEGADYRPRRIYLTEGSNLVGVDPRSGRVRATASGSAVDGAAGVYVVRGGVALGLDQGAGGDAWGYDLAAQRVTLAAAGLPWPHYFVDPSGVGGSAAAAGSLVVIAACAQLAAGTTPASPSGSGSAAASASASGSGSAAASASPFGSSVPPAGASPPASASAPSPSAPSPVAQPNGPACLHPELVALNL